MPTTNRGPGSPSGDASQFQDITEAQLKNAGWELEGCAYSELESSHKLYICRFDKQSRLGTRLLAIKIPAFDELRGDYSPQQAAGSLNFALNEFEKAPTPTNLQQLIVLAFAYFKKTATYRQVVNQYGHTHSLNIIVNAYGSEHATELVFRPAVSSIQKAIDTVDDIEQRSAYIRNHDLQSNPHFFK